MNDVELKREIEATLHGFAGVPAAAGAKKLLNVLGYESDKTFSLTPNTFEGFAEAFIKNQETTFDADKARASEWTAVDVLFQITDDEIRKNHGLFQTRQVDNTIMESFLFFALHLSGVSYNRGDLVRITREINKLTPMPAIILLRYGDCLTIAVIDRRPHKRETSRDVLEKVTLIKDIKVRQPHRAHTEILRDLSLPALIEKFQAVNFDGLHNAWRKTLDTSELNKRFYRELANWYFWAVDQVRFYPGQDQSGPQVIRATNVIRLVTRLIFIWFLREKGLVPDALFLKSRVDELLDYTDAKESTYYKAILQNLFFATLSQTMEHRRWRKEGTDDEKNYYRYRRHFKDAEAALSLFANTPFLNGGLFDHLPQDQFSDRTDTALTVPDHLFFSDEIQVDLNEAYGTKNKKYTVAGLINILDHYKFTVDENTPVEEEIALDPELLGRVFENLLAAYNPETKETARKLTGSYYTPREIVNYMVDESLKAYLTDRLNKESPTSTDGHTEKVSRLLSYAEDASDLSEKEIEGLIDAIHGLRVLDPACGSGAFPMGILHKMVLILSKLDPGNERWRDRQLRAVTDPVLRAHVEKAFDLNEADYGRKLYLIQNCIYGVDIQPIAVQIAKLRFFISLIVDQKIHPPPSDNRGIIPLPNMETKFVAANTLIGLDRPKQTVGLWDLDLEKKEQQLREIREKHFNARTPLAKAECIVRDAAVRKEIAELLKQDHWPPNTASKVANWDPYDVSASAEFFDPESMFELREGFNITIGNPPYVRADSGPEHLAMRQKIIETRQYETLWEKWDLFVPFIERSYKLLAPDGVSSLIV
jgi:adenine-specific DNA-methyltransferase